MNEEKVEDWIQEALTERFGWLTARYNNLFELFIRLNNEGTEIRYIYVMN